MDDEKFIPIYQSSYEITLIEFEPDKRVLAIQLRMEKLLLLLLEEKNLLLLGERKKSRLSKVFLSADEMFLLESEFTPNNQPTAKRIVSVHFSPTMDSTESSDAPLGRQGEGEQPAAPTGVVLAGVEVNAC